MEWFTSDKCPDFHDNAVRAAQAVSGKPKFNPDQWISAHPDVYAYFKRFTLEAIRSGKKVGAKAVAERIRWEAVINGHDGYKVNNSATASMARRFMNEYPEYGSYFNTREKS